MPSSARPLALVVTSTLPRWPHDAEPRFILDLCNALAGTHRVLVLAPHGRGAATHERWGDVDIRRFHYFAGWGEALCYEGGMLPKLRRQPWLWALVPFFLVAQTLAVARLLRREAPALVHAHWFLPQGLTVRLARLLARRDVPMVCTAHGADVLGLSGAVSRALQRWIARGCARIGVVSGSLRDELVRRGVPVEKLRLLPMGVAIPPAAAATPRDPNLVAFAGRLVEKKGVDVLLDAFARVGAERAGARLCIAGGGPDLERFRARVAAAGLGGRVEFLGAVPRERIEQLFGRAAVAVMPSVTARDGDAEGLGLVMLEAMATGCPVVVSDVPAVRGVMRPDQNGLVFPERDAAALALALRRLLDDRALAEKLGATGRADVAQRFSWASVAASHAAVYAEAAAGSPT